MKLKIFTFALLSCFAISCNKQRESEESKEQEATAVAPQSEAYELVAEMIQKVGDYKTLSEKKDVVYTYTYQTPDGKADVSTEKYLFDQELSYGLYQKHERTFEDLEGQIEQGYDGTEFWLKHNGTVVNDTTRLKRVAFNRPTNFYWFTMMQKLQDPGLIYEYLKEVKIDSETYDVVKISFESIDGTPKDTYQLYINKETKLVDQFLFTVADFGKFTPLLMVLEYENIDGMLLPTKRKYKASNWDAKVTNDPWINVTWTDIKFNNNLSKADFKK